jgi:hypothetical protein
MRTATEKRPRTRIIRLVIEGLAESLIFVEARSPAFVRSNRDGPDDRGPLCPTLNDACLNDPYPGHNVDTAERHVCQSSISAKTLPVSSLHRFEEHVVREPQFFIHACQKCNIRYFRRASSRVNSLAADSDGPLYA